MVTSAGGGARSSARAAFAAFAALAACLPSETPEPGAKTRPHIVLVTADALRADHLSLFGYPRQTSPRLDAFAQRATNFRRAVAVIPKTGPSFATLFTGLLPREHGVRSNFGTVPAQLSTLAERLRGAGYRTAAFVANPALRSSRGFDRGFDSWVPIPAVSGRELVNPAFLAWARDGFREPTFVWLHYLDPHGPYEPPQELLAPFLADELAASAERVPLDPAEPPFSPNKLLGAVPHYQRIPGEDRVAVYVARYDAEIRRVDRSFGEVLDFLDSHGLADDTAVIFSSDHGESLGEHEFYFEHGWFAYEPTLHVPLLIRLPGQEEGATDDRLVSTLDLHATLLALARVPPAPGSRGVDLFGGEEPEAHVLIENADRYPIRLRGLRTAGWKYLFREDDGSEELYRLSDDPDEQNNLVRLETERLVELRQAFREALADGVEADTPAPSQADDPETRERLRALGYVEP